MLGAMLEDGVFGAKLVSVYPDNFAQGGPSHQGVVALFDAATGAPSAMLDAGEITAIRTAAASAAATDALARQDARSLAILGYGEQARRHLEAIRHVRADRAGHRLGPRFRQGASVRRRRLRNRRGGGRGRRHHLHRHRRRTSRSCARNGSPDGAHINAVGSSRAGPRELDDALVARARLFADHEAGVRAQGAEYLHALAAGAIGRIICSARSAK